MKAELLLPCHACLGEGAFYDDRTNRLLWLDIFGYEVHALNPVTDTDICYKVSKPITTIVPAEEGFVVGAIDGVYRLNADCTVFTQLPSPKVDYAHFRCNDGKCAPDGRFWIGLVEKEGQKGLGTLYVIDDDTCTLILHELDCPNGIVWNKRQDQMYFTDSLSGRIYAFDYTDGKICNKRVIFHTDAGYPDGMTIDTDDKLWVAVWGSGCVYRIDPCNGKVLEIVETSAPNVSSVAIANKRLYITSATKDMSAEQIKRYPLSGGLFVAQVDAIGASAFHYRG